MYQLDTNFRAATLLGLVGADGIGNFLLNACSKRVASTSGNTCHRSRGPHYDYRVIVPTVTGIMRQLIRRRSLRKRVRREMTALGLHGPPTEVGEICGRLAERRGRPLHLMPMDMHARGPYGLWVATARADYICYQRQTSRAHQDHIILHEIGHILAEHDAADIADGEVLRRLAPNLSPGLVARFLARTDHPHHDSATEREAEDIATMLLERADVARKLRLPTSSERAGRAQAALDRGPGSWL